MFKSTLSVGYMKKDQETKTAILFRIIQENDNNLIPRYITNIIEVMIDFETSEQLLSILENPNCLKLESQDWQVRIIDYEIYSSYTCSSRLIYSNNKTLLEKFENCLVYMKITVISSLDENKMKNINIDFIFPSSGGGNPELSIQIDKEKIYRMKNQIISAQNELLHVKYPIMYTFKDIFS